MSASNFPATPLVSGRGIGLVPRGKAFLHAHPALFLGLMAPMVEYLTGSTQLSWLVLNPPLFFLFLAQNLGSYGLAVLLIREAKVRWGKGWATVLLLGAAYGILNEGIGAATLFDPNQAAVLGIVSTYGHWLGVNWPWAVELVLIIHPLFSVSLPILLLDLALPQTRGRSLLDLRQVRWALVGLGVDGAGTLVLIGYVRSFYAGPVLWAACLVAMAGLSVAAYRVRADLLLPPHPRPTVSPLTMFGFAVGFFLLITFGSDALASNGAAPAFLVLLFLAAGGLALGWVVQHLGRRGSDRHLLALCTGMVAVLLPQGFFGQIGTGFGMVPVVAGDLLVVALLAHLWRRYGALGASGQEKARPASVSLPVGPAS